MELVSDEQIIRVLRNSNPWWRDRAMMQEKSKPWKRSAYYEALKNLCHKKLRHFVRLSGISYAGKTTVLYQLMEYLLQEGIHPYHILYVPYDNLLMKQVSVERVISIYESLFALKGRKYVFLDEFQYAAKQEMWMQRLYHERRDICLIVAESVSLAGGAEWDKQWKQIRISTMSFYEYCSLLALKEPVSPEKIALTDLIKMNQAELAALMESFLPLDKYFKPYLLTGAFPNLALSEDIYASHKILRDKMAVQILKQNVLPVFSIRNPDLLERLFLYLCMNATKTFSITKAAKELGNISVTTLESYLHALEQSHIVHLAKPVAVDGQGSLKGKPKIYIADAALRNAVLMLEDVLSDEREMEAMVKSAVYQHVYSFYQGQNAQIGYFRKAKDNRKELDVVVEMPYEKILCDVRYRYDVDVSASDAIVELCRSKGEKRARAFLVTKGFDDFGVMKLKTETPVMRIPAVVFLYLLGMQKQLSDIHSVSLHDKEIERYWIRKIQSGGKD